MTGSGRSLSAGAALPIGPWCVGALTFAALLALNVGGARAEEAKPDDPKPPAVEPPPPPLPSLHRITYTELLGVRVNPLGLENRFTIGYEHRLYDDPGILFRDAYFGVKPVVIISPAVMRLGGQLELKPLAVLALRGGIFGKYWFGSFNQLSSQASPHQDHSDTTMEAENELGLNVATAASEIEVGALAQAKAGPVVIRNDLAFYRADADLEDGERVSYDIRLDMVVPDGGWSLTNDTDLALLFDFGLIVGARNSVGHAFYRDRDFAPGEDTENPNTPFVRFGPLAGFTFFDEPGAAFNKPTILVLGQWWLLHRYRTGQDVSQAIPMITVALRAEGELWGSGKD